MHVVHFMLCTLSYIHFRGLWRQKFQNWWRILLNYIWIISQYSDLFWCIPFELGKVLFRCEETNLVLNWKMSLSSKGRYCLGTQGIKKGLWLLLSLSIIFSILDKISYYSIIRVCASHISLILIWIDLNNSINTI